EPEINSVKRKKTSAGSVETQDRKEEEYDSEIEEMVMEENPSTLKPIGASTPYHDTLMGYFNVALNTEDTHAGSSSMNLAMCEFKDCVSNIEVLDVNSSGLHYTWNRKPRGGDGVLKKLDRIMGNLDLIYSFPGVHAIFQPYIISDHSSTVLKFPSLVVSKPKPFKFYNFLTFKSKFIEIVNNHWNFDIEGHNMFKVVSKLKLLKKPLRKLLHDQGNLHERVNLLRIELDNVQKALDSSLDYPILREEEGVYTIKSKNQRSRIETILNSNNVEVSGSMVPEVFVKHYEQFLGSDMECANLNVEGLFFKTIHLLVAGNMVRNVTNKEIKDAMFDIGDEKPRVRTGLHPCFLKRVRTSLVMIFATRFETSFRMEIQLINVCFADDLFIFARGEAQSAQVIMDAHEEFKLASRLVPSLPKSTVYFCNVLPLVKNAILSIMPFSEEGSYGVMVRLFEGNPKFHGRSYAFRRDSLWERWIHTYKLQGRSFWDVHVKSDTIWGGEGFFNLEKL
nr:hypothetical protein [Tanacetum cinerariifolium]